MYMLWESFTRSEGVKLYELPNLRLRHGYNHSEMISHFTKSTVGKYITNERKIIANLHL